jgi:uncharacterized BrkB/YihY/UPF0761 family membrane protein
MKKSRFLWIEYDKWLHLMVGYIITLTFGLYGYLFIGILLTFVAAILKEVRDHFHPETSFDWWDFIWTLYGILPAIFILFTI